MKRQNSNTPSPQDATTKPLHTPLQDFEFAKELIDQSRSGIIGMDEAGHIVIWNQGAERLFAKKATSCLGQTPEQCFEGDAPFKAGHDGRRDEFPFEVNGRKLYLNISCNCMRDEQGMRQGSSALVRDVTEMVELRLAMEGSERLSHLGTMVAGIAHEVGNPLASISGLVQSLQARVKDDELLHSRLGLVKEQVGRIHLLIRQLADYSRPQTAKRRSVDLNEVIREAAKLMRFDERSHQVELTLTLDEKLQCVQAVPHQLQQVFVNLLKNGFDASEGQSFRSLSVSTRYFGSYAECVVQDNGPGLGAGLEEEIFEPFFTTKEPGKGTGLGLWICRGIVETLPGRIWVESLPGQGARFHIRFEQKEA
jgi:PAS domain S-box-containing protein